MWLAKCTKKLCGFAMLGSVLLTTVVTADQTPGAEDVTPLLEQLAERVAVQSQVAGEFRQEKTLEVLPNPLVSHGEFSYRRDDGLLWRTTRPVTSELRFDDQGIRQNQDGETLWEIDADQPAAVTITQVMTGILAADWGVLQQYFHLSGGVADDGWHLQLIPRDQALSRIVDRLLVRGDRQLQSLTMEESNGDRTLIEFTFH